MVIEINPPGRVRCPDDPLPFANPRIENPVPTDESFAPRVRDWVGRFDNVVINGLNSEFVNHLETFYPLSRDRLRVLCRVEPESLRPIAFPVQIKI